ncbi:MAG: M48 family metalloprotease [Pseudomonadota bacterium]
MHLFSFKRFFSQSILTPALSSPQIISIIGVMLCLFACTVNPVTLKREFNIISEEREIRLGRNASASVPQVFGGLYDDVNLQEYINEVGQHLVKVSDRDYLQFYFQIVDSPILNAFAVPGGFIYITRGLLAELENEAQLAAVLGHEIGHVCARHSATQLSAALGYQVLTLASIAAGPNAGEMVMVTTALSQTIMSGYSREKEFQADSMGLTYMYRAGYNPMEVSTFLSHLSKRSQGPGGYSSYNASHPDIFDRIRETQSNAKLMLALDITRDKLKEQNSTGEAAVTREEVMTKGGKVLEDEYKSHLEGLLFGPPENPRRIRIYTVKKGETLTSIAGKVLGDKNRAEEIADLNDLEMDTELHPGKTLKVIF